MYARFLRWASDRIAENGVVAFISNRSYIDSRTFDGFRDVVACEFNEIHIVDLGADVRANPKLSGTRHNVFGIQTGVAIGFLVKRAKAQGCRIFHSRRPEFETAEEKLAWLSSARFDQLERTEITPDARHNWLNLTDNDFDTLVPVASKAAKKSKNPSRAKAICGSFASGIKTNRDDWVYDFDAGNVKEKVTFFHDHIASIAEGRLAIDSTVKWSADLKTKLRRGLKATSSSGSLIGCTFRPFVERKYWANRMLSDRLTDLHYQAFGPSLANKNPTIAFLCVYSSNPLAALAIDGPFDYCMLKQGNGGTESISFYRYDESGNRVDNITNWALKQFRAQYKTGPSSGATRHLLPEGEGKSVARAKSKARAITRMDIFHYVHAVLHDPVYREKDAQNLKREFPRIPSIRASGAGPDGARR